MREHGAICPSASFTVTLFLLQSTYWEHSKEKASSEPLRARNSTEFCCFPGESDLNSEKEGFTNRGRRQRDKWYHFHGATRGTVNLLENPYLDFGSDWRCRDIIQDTFQSRQAREICQVRKVAERKFPEFFEFLSRILPRISLRIFPEFFGEFSCFVSWETETIRNSPKFPAIFQCKIPRQIRKTYSQNISGEEAKSKSEISGKFLHCFFECPVDFTFPGCLCNLVNVDILAQFLGGEKRTNSCHISGLFRSRIMVLPC